ncbi:helix-turn-helix domain-containing protein [Brucella thiophenivorans]|uniref:DNA-binding protein n=1 Tax=Brucella thiophenivorans TaxID=571255 RepID=A0A256EZY7_9HYPH|nr:helix-turn-helix transcriptional regulator [Brucella thiophenivorans]OYR07986.1 DNA-binding protein [Brucella thiophenivorans]
MSSFQPELYNTMIELLIAARKNAGITQVELGKRIGQRQTFISKFEQGERRLDIAEFIAVSRAIGADPIQIIKSSETAGL